jgi:hypothetical protein
LAHAHATVTGVKDVREGGRDRDRDRESPTERQRSRETKSRRDRERERGARSRASESKRFEQARKTLGDWDTKAIREIERKERQWDIPINTYI